MIRTRSRPSRSHWPSKTRATPRTREAELSCGPTKSWSSSRQSSRSPGSTGTSSSPPAGLPATVGNRTMTARLAPSDDALVTRVDIPVSGMTCAACQARVQRSLVRQPGVRDAAVNLMTRTASVTYDPTEASPQELVDAIRNTGYGADLPVGRSVPEEQEAAERDSAAECEE